MGYTVHQLSMAATAWTPWVDLRRNSVGSIVTECGDVNDPVGVLSLEASNDVLTVEAELRAGTLPASTAAKFATLTIGVAGNAWATAYDGVGIKFSFAAPVVFAHAFARVKYLRTSGGAGDTLTVRWVLTGTK